MAVLFEAIKWIFFMMTIAFALLMLRGDYLFDETTLAALKMLILPGYLIFCGVIIGYMIALFVINKSEDSQEQQSQKYARSFLLGSFIGVGLAVTSIFMM